MKKNIFLKSQHDNRTNIASTRLDLNVLPVYHLGITGRGIRVAVLDDGLEYTHEDLSTNYVSILTHREISKVNFFFFLLIIRF